MNLFGLMISAGRILSVRTTVSVDQVVPGAAPLHYSYSILDATDSKCRTYSQVCCRDPAPPTPPSCQPGVASLVDLRLADWCQEEETATATEVATTEMTSKSAEETATATEVATTEMTSKSAIQGVRKKSTTEKAKDMTTIRTVETSTTEKTSEAGTTEPVSQAPRDKKVVTPSILPLDYSPQCGQHHSSGYRQTVLNMVHTEHESQFGEWPSTCAVLYRGAYICSASLLSPGALLTAAHCLDSRPTPGLSVRCGDWDSLNDLAEALPHQERQLDRVTLHPEFDTERGARGNLRHDLAVLVPVLPFQLGPHIDTVCLPEPEEDFTGESCAATGWGKDRWGDQGRYQAIMKEVWMEVVGQESCQQKLRQTKLGRFFSLHSSFLCAGGTVDVDMCTGDGGSPLLCYRAGRMVQVGVVAWGVECGLPDVPGAYVNIAQYICWIREQVAPLK